MDPSIPTWKQPNRDDHVDEDTNSANHPERGEAVGRGGGKRSEANRRRAAAEQQSFANSALGSFDVPFIATKREDHVD